MSSYSSMLRRLIVPVAAGALLLSAAMPALADGDPGISITPAAASQSDTYEIDGVNLQPGLALDINFQSPDGNVYSTAALNQVVVVADDGSFAFQFVPTTEFAGESLGDWGAQVCISGTDTCVQGTFTIGQ